MTFTLRPILAPLAGYGAGWAAARAVNYFSPALALNPTAMGVAAAVGALFFALVHDMGLSIFKDAYLEKAGTPKLTYDQLQWIVTGGAAFLSHQALKTSHKLTFSHALLGVFIGAEAKMAVDGFIRWQIGDE